MSEREAVYEANDRAILLARAKAIEAVIDLNLPKRIELPSELTGCGRFMARDYGAHLSAIQKLHGKDVPSLVALAASASWYSIFEGSLWFRYAIEFGVVADTDYCRTFTQPNNYAEREGWAWTMYNKLGQLNAEATLRSFDIPFAGAYPTAEALLEAIGLHWMQEGIRSDRRGVCSVRIGRRLSNVGSRSRGGG